MALHDFEAVIGLEIHVQLATASKLFCADSTAFGGHDNENVCPTCAGMPGTLPVLNARVVDYAIKTGLALNTTIRERSVFARKQYFYPDLPKGYQISQYDQPICENGYVDIVLSGNVSQVVAQAVVQSAVQTAGANGELSEKQERKRVSITRAHIEEDAGKSTHQGDYTLINLNRAGVPLLEIVSGPDMHSAAEAAEYARTVRKIVRYLGVCDGNLEEGSLRCDCNVSVRRRGETRLGTKVEIKNINSFRFIEKAIDYEIMRQIDCVETGEKIVQETRLYDPDKNRTFTMRTKEDAHDYRYFPDPDLLTIEVTEEMISEARRQLPELPLVRADRFVHDFQLSPADAVTLTTEKPLADYYEDVVRSSKNARSSANWVMTELMRELNERKLDIEQSPVSAQHLGELIGLIDAGTISGKIAKTVFQAMVETQKPPAQIVREKNLVQITDTAAIATIIDDLLAKHPAEVADYRAGKEKLLGFFVGQAMRATKGQASPDVVNEVLKQRLKG